MSVYPVEYVLARQHGMWTVLRDGRPTGRRSLLFDAVEFATHLAEREASRTRRGTRVVMDQPCLLVLPGLVAYG
ncbi:hypothetical protein [Dyella amyloliquefaciens]|uniref:hypothetical protein n=1 Tax=Dyella amyloliquefaciens TaxID=1770545 RepID=UPI00102E2254|nr:hypothetical protein [Dyella amyloliquefaciens]